MKREQCVHMLKEGLVDLTFEKKDGTIRHARATLSMDFIPGLDHPKGTGVPYTDTQLRFYDTDAEGWRSCLIENITSFTEVPGDSKKE